MHWILCTKPRRIYDAIPDVHLRYFGLFFEIGKQVDKLLDSPQVQIGTAVCLDKSGETNWHIIEKRDDANPMRSELDVNDPLAQQLLGKTVNDEIVLRETPFGEDIGEKLLIFKANILMRTKKFVENFLTGSQKLKAYGQQNWTILTIWTIQRNFSTY